ncbi:MAG: sugar transferase [Flavobacteriales bacterium]|nr:sugar transferase [Flavobacteriales bacterium]
MKNNKLWIAYLLSDWLSAVFAWSIFNFFRKNIIEKQPFEIDEKFKLSIIIIPIIWLLLYFAFGAYKNVYRRHRIKEVSQTLLLTLIGTFFIFFAFLLDDQNPSYQDHYTRIIGLFSIHAIVTFIPRFAITSVIVNKIHQRKIGFPTLIIGSNIKAVEIFQELRNMKKSTGHQLIGYISTNGGVDKMSETNLTKLGDYTDLENIISKQNIEEVIIATEPKEHDKINKIINDLADLNVKIKVITDMYNILTGSVKINSIFGALLIEINPEIMPAWQKSLKRFMDVSISIVAIALLCPIYILLSILVKLSSKGSIIYKQERIGLNGRSFYIYKFRSMFKNSEDKGPQLSSQHDKRITPIGKLMRRSRLDEIPQFFNVIKGEMSLVGPRPERQHYINLILEQAPHYKHIKKVKPGITSWGQVKYGYAENVEEMISRLKFDLLYVENMSLMLDFKILFYTIIIMLKGSGK